MSGNAAYEVTVTGTDDETFSFTLPFENTDGSTFPFSSYEIEYSLTRDGSRVLSLTQGSGITVAVPNVTFANPNGTGALRHGEYEHGCRIRDLVSGIVVQVFDGSVIISEGNFR